MERITIKVNNLLLIRYTKQEFCDMLGISRPTLDTRLKQSNWKKTEAKYIESIN